MRDVGDEIPADLFEPPEVGQVAEDHQQSVMAAVRAAPAAGARPELDGLLPGAVEPDVGRERRGVGGSRVGQCQQFGARHGEVQCLALDRACAELQQVPGGLVDQDNAAFAVQREDPFAHAGEDALAQGALVRELAHLLFQTLARLVDRMG